MTHEPGGGAGYGDPILPSAIRSRKRGPGDGNCQSMPQRGRAAGRAGAAAICGRSGKTPAESGRSGLSAQFFPAISKVGTAPAR